MNSRIQSNKRVVDRGVKPVGITLFGEKPSGKLKHLRGFREISTAYIPYDAKKGILYADNLGLTQLPPLPFDLKELRCSSNRLKTLPALPPTLKCLSCSNNLLKSLPNLPCSLKELNCSDNLIKELPALPTSLVNLRVSNNSLSGLNACLPPSLEYLDCSHNRLLTLPQLPDSLKTLICYKNLLQFLPCLKNVEILCGEGNNWNPRFQEMMTAESPFELDYNSGFWIIPSVWRFINGESVSHASKKSLALIHEFHENARIEKAKARAVLNVPILKDRLPDDLLNVLGSFLSGSNAKLEKQIEDLHDRVMGQRL